jgi:Ni/Fe-hydrogenase subunit HybB-like protein
MKRLSVRFRRRALDIRPGLRIVLAGAIAVMAVSLAVSSLNSPAFSQDPEEVCPGYRAVEQTSYSIETAFWPPGTKRCEYTTPTGQERHSTYTPWIEWVSLGLVAMSLALAVAGMRALVSPWAARLLFVIPRR